MSGFPADYQNNFNASKNYTKHLHFPGKGLTAAELNEIQETLDNKRIKFQKTLMKEGDIVDGGNPVVRATGDVTIPAGAIYVNNDIREFEEANFTIPTTEVVKLGVFLKEEIITSIEDPDLLDPSGTVAPGLDFATSGLETSQRLKESIIWGFIDEAGTPSEAEGVFYESHKVDNGILINEGELPFLDGVVEVVASYDRNVNGDYLVEGLDVDFDVEDTDTNEYIFSIQSGLANVNGFQIERPSSDRIFIPVNPVLQTVNDDPAPINIQTLTHTETLTKGVIDGIDTLVERPVVLNVLTVSDGVTTYTSGVDFTVSGNDIDWSLGGAEPTVGEEYTVEYEFEGTVLITDKGPLDSITNVTAQLRVSESVVRGTVANTSDSLTSIPVVNIIEITQSGNPNSPFVAGVDFNLVGSDVDWSPGGNEPAPGSTYDVVYTFNDQLLADVNSLGLTQFTVAKDQADGILEDGTTALIDYDFRLQRTDVLQLTSVGTIQRVEGISSETNPIRPPAGDNAIALASITYDFVNEPAVQNIGNRAKKQAELSHMQQQIINAYDVIADLELEIKTIREGASGSGIFTDKFSDDTKSDLGVPQTATIVDDLLTLPTTITSEDLDNTNNEEFQTLDFTLEEIIDQSSTTGSIKINPFATFTPPDPISVDIKFDHRVQDFVEQAIANAFNNRPTSYGSKTEPPRITNIPGSANVITEPPILPVSKRSTFTETRALVLNSKGKKKLRPKGRRQLIRLQSKINSGENITVARIGKHKIDLVTGEVLKKFN